jgi:hypothetical protein
LPQFAPSSNRSPEFLQLQLVYGLKTFIRSFARTRFDLNKDPLIALFCNQIKFALPAVPVSLDYLVALTNQVFGSHHLAVFTENMVWSVAHGNQNAKKDAAQTSGTKSCE